jgi:hypothetical protein
MLDNTMLYAHTLVREGKLEEASAIMMECLEGYKEQDGARSESVARVLYELGTVRFCAYICLLVSLPPEFSSPYYFLRV